MQNSQEKPGTPRHGGQPSGQIGIDSDLQAVIDAWPRLPVVAQTQILSIIAAAGLDQ